jgi:hypothetical protein
MSTPSLYTLPVELLHRIVDHVDTETVFFSFRIVCKYFYAIIGSYNQYKLDFRSITKPAFHRICHLIQPENVVSLILSNDHRTSGQINLFQTLFDLSRFTRLHSLTLIQTDNTDLTVYSQHISTCPLVSLSISRPKIGYPAISIENHQVLTNCPIRYLSLTQWTSPKEIFHIFRHYPYLETLLLDGVIMPRTRDNFADTVPFISQLKSLTINGYSPNADMIMLVLPCTPSLVHLKLIGGLKGLMSAWDGYWWAEFIEKNLPKLQFFEFFFDKRTSFEESTCDIESIITSFRTSFWIEKRWYVTCDYYQNIRELNLYSIPICKSTILYKSETNKISCTNAMNDIPYIMDNVHSLTLNSIPTTVDTVPSRPLFSRVTKLSLLVTNHFSNGSIDYISSLIDLSHVETISVTLDLSEESCNAIQMVLRTLFDLTFNLQSLHFCSTRLENLTRYWKIMSLIIPKRVKHLIFDIVATNEVQWIIDTFENFSSITFQSKASDMSIFINIFDGIKTKGKDFTFYKNSEYVSFWFGEQKLNTEN